MVLLREGSGRPGAEVHLTEAERGEKACEPLTGQQQDLVAGHLGLVGVHLRSRVRRGGHPRRIGFQHDDLFQAGCMGLIEAATHYRPGHCGSFAAYALPRIRRSVHAALLGEPSVVRVPYGRASIRRLDSTPHTHRTLSLTREPALAEARSTLPGLDPAGEAESIRHTLRARFVHAAEQVLERMAVDSRGRADAGYLYARVAADRVLVPDPARRTPVRRLAQELGVSSGQISVLEQRILAGIQAELAADVQVGLLVEFARHDPSGFDGLVDEARSDRLRAAELGAFERRFVSLDRDAQARWLYALLQRSTGRIPEIAVNLYRLVQGLS